MKPKGWHKYKAVAVEVDGIRFDSKKEATRYTELLWLERDMQIKDLKRQVTYPLVVCGVKVCSYRPDFVYIEGGKIVAEDVKGFQTPEFKLKAKLFQAVYPAIELRIT